LIAFAWQQNYGRDGSISLSPAVIDVKALVISFLYIILQTVFKTKTIHKRIYRNDFYAAHFITSGFP